MGIGDEVCNCCGVFVEDEQHEASGGYCKDCEPTDKRPDWWPGTAGQPVTDF